MTDNNKVDTAHTSRSKAEQVKVRATCESCRKLKIKCFPTRDGSSCENSLIDAAKELMEQYLVVLEETKFHNAFSATSNKVNNIESSEENEPGIYVNYFTKDDRTGLIVNEFFDPATIDINTVKDWTGCLQLFFAPGFKALAQDAHPKSKEVDLLDDDHSDPDSHSEDDPSKLSYHTSSGIDYQKVMGCLDRYVTDPTDLQDQLRPFFEILVVRFQTLHVANGWPFRGNSDTSIYVP
ncbi:hypothetical protein KCU99_g1909, partial [Aureobasidium melanogenum]